MERLAGDYANWLYGRGTFVAVKRMIAKHLSEMPIAKRC